MEPTPWVTLAPAEPDAEYLVMLTYLPLARLRKLPAFLRVTLAIRRQLEHTDGVLGYSMRARPLRLQFWTLSAWRNRAALNAFVRVRPHLGAMADLRGGMGSARFIEWRVRGATLPPKWEDAMQRFERETADG